jgi:aromatic ring-opening dioxygenase LigB subunit
MSIVAAFIMPHPPIILKEIGGGEEIKIQKTIYACEEIAKKISEIKPDTIVLISPHAIIYKAGTL